MGSNDGNDDENPIHSVTLSSFYLSRHEVTFNEYDAFCDDTNRDKPDDEGWGRGTRPVINISWHDAVAYCNWRSRLEGKAEVYTIRGEQVTANWQADGYRLPTESEWEYAARSEGTNQTWAGTNSEKDLYRYGNFCDKNCSFRWKKKDQNDQYPNTAPVGSFLPNDQGLFDMSGNVYEWCWDWKGAYSGSAQTNPRGSDEGSYRVLRGGSWYNVPAYLRCSNRNFGSPGDRSRSFGFRLSRAGN